MTKLTVAIDGGAGTGTSTAAEGVAKALGIPHLNTGSMYRAITWECQRQGVDLADGEACARIAGEAEMGFDAGKVVKINGCDVREELYSGGIGRVTPIVAGHQHVRSAMVRIMKAFAEANGAVMEGRATATEVLPDTPYKFFFVCDAKERIRRLRLGGRHDETLESLMERDRVDEAHEHGTFRRHDDAIEVDTTAMSPQQVIDAIVEIVRA